MPLSSKDFDIFTYIKANKIARELFNSCYSLKSVRYYYSKKLSKFERVKDDKALFDHIRYDYPSIVTAKGGLDLPQGYINNLFFHNSIERVSETTDLFQKEPLTLTTSHKVLSIVSNEYSLNKPVLDNSIKDIENISKIIIDDYKSHFKEFDDILHWIIACRFTDDRRSSYLHLRIDAGFGKDFFQAIFSKLKILTKLRYDDFKSPSPITADRFRNSFLMIINEFKVFKKEFKDMTNHYLFDSKYGFSAEVDIYGKIFLSAEHSVSFENGTDKQILDRVNIIDKKSNNLASRGIYAQYGNKLYHNVITSYVYDFFIKEFKIYLDLGLNEASIKATAQLNEFNAIYRLRAELLEVSIRKVFWTAIFYIVDNLDNKEPLNHLELDIAKNIKKSQVGNKFFIYIKSLKKVFELISKNEDEAFYKKSRYKTSEIFRILEIEDNPIKAYMVDNKTIKAFRFSTSEVIENKNSDGSTQDFTYMPDDIEDDKPF